MWLKSKDFKVNYCYLECYSYQPRTNTVKWQFTNRIPTRNLYQRAREILLQSIKSRWFLWPIRLWKPTSSHQQNNSCTSGIQLNLRCNISCILQARRAEIIISVCYHSALGYFINLKINKSVGEAISIPLPLQLKNKSSPHYWTDYLAFTAHIPNIPFKPRKHPDLHNIAWY